ncbi:hypothetical protein C9374_008778 [Naegleria lovaniensis]|uniref:Uncharacterized protein n=1 Tax=Naegleria lovaniensis TaxID=51637 RepID=A0AA88GKJ9_NAELO|nr:uncharacterized protein C9374_008778 [Naegleria lovaniensis]KAG2378156.1 hypothetical protein C9374_008778 [Naegleria lovaniensis]
MNNDDEEPVRLVLHELGHEAIGTNPIHRSELFNHDWSDIFSKFFIKMKRNNIKKKVPFSLNFDHVASIQVSGVVDVRISYSCHCIIALEAPYFHCFDLTTHQKLFSFSSAATYFSYFDIERNYDGVSNDALVYTSVYGIFKHDLTKIMKCQNANDKIWIREEYNDSACGIACSSHVDHVSKNVIFVAIDPEPYIAVLMASTGELLYKIDQLYLKPSGFCGIAVNDTQTELFIAQASECMQKIKRHSQQVNQWTFQCLFGKGSVKKVYGLTIDHASHHIIVCDRSSHGVGVFTEDGVFVKRFGSFGTGPNEFKNPTGICLDEQTGLLYIVDVNNDRIQIFK